MEIREIAAKIIYRVLKDKAYSDKLLLVYSKNIFNEADKKFLYTLVKGTIKMQLNLDYIAKTLANNSNYEKTLLEIKIILYLALYQIFYLEKIPHYAILHQSVELAKKKYGQKIANFVNAVLRKAKEDLLEKIKYPLGKEISLKYSYPDNLLKIWQKEFSSFEIEELCKYFNKPAKIHLRVNNLVSNKEEIKDYFIKNKIKFWETELSEDIFVVENSSVLKSAFFTKGAFSVQDLSASLVVQLLDIKKNEEILDLFAAPGGKASYISQILQNTGKVLAVDISKTKIEKIKEATIRLKINNLHCLCMDSFEFSGFENYSKILLDVPCLGFGVLLKKAELRYPSKQKIKEILSLQRKILQNVGEKVKIGTHLVYSTCALHREENEEQIKNFLKNNDNFKLIDAKNYVSQKITTKEGFLKIIPYKYNCDGVFAAILKKIN